MQLNDWFTLFASIGALLFSFLVYRRDASFQNSNLIYEQKIKVYGLILAELNRLVNALSDKLVTAKLHLENPRKTSGEEMDKTADEADDIIFAFDDLVITNSIIIPKKVLNPLNEFSSFLINTETDLDENQVDKELVQTLDALINTIITKANSLNELMRADLHIEKLNDNLYKRLK